MKVIYTCFFLFISLIARCQDTGFEGFSLFNRKNSANYLGIRFGGLVSTFTHDGSFRIPSPGKNSVAAWHAGLALDLFTKKNYNSRIELSYLSKGARETFKNDRISIESVNRSKYLQLSVLPLIVRPNFKKVNPYIAFGGYYARRIGIRSKSKTDQGSWQEDMVTADNLNVKNDYGYSVSTGVYVWRRPIFELRYEAGLPSVSSTSRIKNRSLILSFSI